MTASNLVEHFFRHEYGRLVATLSRRIGVEYVEDVEDAVQFALISALENWTIAGLPDNPSAWLFRVASNNLIGQLRKGSRRRRILGNLALERDFGIVHDSEVSLPGEFDDDLLRMLFVCCDDAIPPESQLVFALKTLCGFDVREIAIRLFTSEANVYKRLSRARRRLQVGGPAVVELSSEQCGSRIPSIHRVLYLLFTEGYLSSNATLAIRRELCEEAIRLTGILARHQLGKTPETCALMALMHLHAARLSSRQNEAGRVVAIGGTES